MGGWGRLLGEGDVGTPLTSGFDLKSSSTSNVGWVLLFPKETQFVAYRLGLLPSTGALSTT